MTLVIALSPAATRHERPDLHLRRRLAVRHPHTRIHTPHRHPKGNPMNETPTSEILNRAADLIEQRGWSTGGDAWGVSLNGEPPAPVPLCIEGGIIAALGIRAPLSDAVEAVSQCPAYQAVMEYVTPRMASLSCVQSDHLYRFNDSVARSASEVIEVLRACAVIEASRERETAEASHA